MHCEMRLRLAGLRVNAYYYQPSQCVSVAHYPDQHGTPSLLDTNTATKGRGEVLGATNACLQRARLSSGLVVAEVGSILDPRLVGAAQKHRRPIELEGGLRYAEVRRRGGACAEQQQGDNHGAAPQIKIKATHTNCRHCQTAPLLVRVREAKQQHGCFLANAAKEGILLRRA